MARFSAPDKGFAEEERRVPPRGVEANRRLDSSKQRPRLGGVSPAMAAAYNGLRTEAAHAAFLDSALGEQLRLQMGEQHGVQFWQWLSSIRGLAKPDSYSGPEGEAEIEAMTEKVAAIQKAEKEAAAAADKAAKAADKPAPAAAKG